MVEQLDEVRRRFATRLNEHGYAFTYAVLESITKNPQGWRVEASEFPVDVRGKGTRIDFVLRHWRASLFLVGECKRANPRTASWCFAKATPASQLDKGHLTKVVIEDIRQGKFLGSRHERTGMDAWTTDLLHHVACEVRTDESGSAGGKNIDEIEAALTQVLRGVNGLAEWMVGNPGVIPRPSLWKDFKGGKPIATKPIGLLPVIFTTARLFSSDVDLSSADLETGKVTVTEGQLREVSWLHFQYYQSPSLLSAIPSAHVNETLIGALHKEFTRTVAFVTPGGIQEFLRQTSELAANSAVSPWWDDNGVLAPSDAQVDGSTDAND